MASLAITAGALLVTGIENGELAYPVSEITIAGNLKGYVQEHHTCQ